MAEKNLPDDREVERENENLESPLDERRASSLHPRKEDLADIEPGQRSEKMSEPQEDEESRRAEKPRE